MSITTEWLFVLLIIALYVHDSAALLFDNEILLEWGTRPRVLFGSDTVTMFGKELVILNPLTPWRPVFRLSWQARPPLADGAPRAETGFAELASQLSAIRWALPQIAIGLFVGIPVCLFLNAGWLPFLVVVGVVYVGILAAVVNLWIARPTLKISGRRFIGLAFESFACPPCALNLVRRVSVALPLAEDALSVVRRALPEADSRHAVDEIRRRVDADLAMAEEGSADWHVLSDYRRRLPGKAK